MSIHIFANIVTQFGAAANNRGDNQGSNISPLQKLMWYSEPHTTVSAEAIRFAFRRRLKGDGLPCNRHWAEHPSEIPQSVLDQMLKVFKGVVKTPCGYFLDPDFSWYRETGAIGYADDDLLGFMSAEAGREEAEATGADALAEGESVDSESSEASGNAPADEPPASVASAEADEVEEKATTKKGKKKKAKGTNYIRRAVLEMTRAISLTPWAGDVTFNAASAGATPSAQKKGSNPVPYGTELHATRYQYGVALTPERLRDKSRAASAIHALCNLGTVAGNHGRFLFDFSPDAIVIRITEDPAPRLLYCFDTTDQGKTVVAPRLIDRIKSGDIAPDQVIIAGIKLIDSEGKPLAQELADQIRVAKGIKDACARAVAEVNTKLGIGAKKG